MEPSDILDRLAKREGNRWGIGTAAVYLRQVEKAVKGSMSEERWRKSLAEAETKLTYCSEGMAPCDFDADIEPSVGFETVPVKHMGETIHLALPCATKKRQATPDAIMEFDAIVTSSKVDRDHDILEPKGASIDPMLPLLWQHTSWEPIGKLVDVLVQNAKRIKARFAIADTMLGRDALVLVEFGALRISHGFSPTEWEERRDKKTDEWLGYHILKYEVYEVSLVSVPSNTDAIITAFSAEKLHHPQVKEWAKGFHDARPVQGRGTDLGLSQTAGEILDELTSEKSGRSLSKANETRVTSALEDIEAILAVDDAPRAVLALARSAIDSLSEMLVVDEEEDKEPGEEIVSTVEFKETNIADVVAFLTDASDEDLAKASQAIEAFETMRTRDEFALSIE